MTDIDAAEEQVQLNLGRVPRGLRTRFAAVQERLKAKDGGEVSLGETLEALLNEHDQLGRLYEQPEDETLVALQREVLRHVAGIGEVMAFLFDRVKERERESTRAHQARAGEWDEERGQLQKRIEQLEQRNHELGEELAANSREHAEQLEQYVGFKALAEELRRGKELAESSVRQHELRVEQLEGQLRNLVEGHEEETRRLSQQLETKAVELERLGRVSGEAEKERALRERLEQDVLTLRARNERMEGLLAKVEEERTQRDAKREALMDRITSILEKQGIGKAGGGAEEKTAEEPGEAKSD